MRPRLGGAAGLRLPAVVAAALAGAASGPAAAHGLSVVAVADGRCLVGRAWYDEDTPARGDRVTLARVAAPTDTLASTATDETGHFRLEAPPDERLFIVVEGQEQHVAEIAVRSGGGAAGGCAAARGEMAASVASLEQRLRGAYAVAAVSLALAVAGAWWGSRRRGEPPAGRDPDAGSASKTRGVP